MLERHLKRKHKPLFNEALKSGQKKFRGAECEMVAAAKAHMDSFLIPTPAMEPCLLNFVIQTYQPLRIVEEPSFREFCFSLNKSCRILSRDKLGTLLTAKYVMVHDQMRKLMEKRYFAITTDSWTSLAHHNYTTCTAHFIESKTWKLHSFVLGITEKQGTSTAVDTVGYVENQLASFDLHYKGMVAVVTDTEATMIAAGRLLVQNSHAAGGSTRWHGCVDLLLELVTGIAFKDLPESEGTMSACRTLIGFFHSSTQAMAKLLGKQSVGRAVKPIQDVVTRWWSTWSMCDRLLRLKPYLALLEEEGDLTSNLSNAQWIVVADLTATLEPFMIAQRLLEGQNYSTISLIPFLVFKVRKGLEALINCPNSSPHVLSIATKMVEKLQEIFGDGAEGTVAVDPLPEGVRRRPKGIPLLTLMASLLDPRTKGGVGIPAADQHYLFGKIRDSLMAIADEAQAQAVRDMAPRENNNNINNNIINDQRAAPRQRNNMRAMFEELNDYYNEYERLDPNQAGEHNNNNEQQLLNVINAEILLYQQEPPIRLYSTIEGDGVEEECKCSFNCPLDWWKINQVRFPHLANLAKRLLCIPATSAPSERVFSNAGLTIAKDRANLAPDTASELIFLHDAIPALDKYQASLR